MSIGTSLDPGPYAPHNQWPKNDNEIVMGTMATELSIRACHEQIESIKKSLTFSHAAS